MLWHKRAKALGKGLPPEGLGTKLGINIIPRINLRRRLPMVALLGPKLFGYTDLGHPAKKGGFHAVQSVDRRVLAAPPSRQKRAKRLQCCCIRKGCEAVGRETEEPVPWPNLWSSLFGIFSGSGAVERKESVPLPCSFLAWLERSILGGALHEHFVCFAGSVLLCCNSSLRFGDSQHVDWSSLVVDDQVLWGVSWRTKTSRSGCPFGCLCAGFYGGRDLSRAWVGHYLTCLNSVWKRVRAFAPESTPDCLF